MRSSIRISRDADLDGVRCLGDIVVAHLTMTRWIAQDRIRASEERPGSLLFTPCNGLIKERPHRAKRLVH